MSLVYDFSKILEELPYISPWAIKVKQDYGPLPKNLWNYMVESNEKFLNKYQGILEDHAPEHLLEEFKKYQSYYFNDRWNSTNHKESIFKPCNCKTKKTDGKSNN